MRNLSPPAHTPRPHAHASSGWGEAPLCIQACPAVLCPIALCDWGRAGLCSCGNRRHPGVSGEGVADGVHDVGAVLAGSVEVAANGVAVAGGGLGAEPARDLLLGFRRAQVALGLIWISR